MNNPADDTQGAASTPTSTQPPSTNPPPAFLRTSRGENGGQAPAAPQLPQAGAPNIGGYKLVEPLSVTPDGEIWLGHEMATGAPHGVALLSKPALTDPGAIWRLKQDFALLVPAPRSNSGRPGDPNERMKLVVVDPPQLADDAVNLRQARTARPGNALNAPPPVRKVRTEEERRKERKTVIVVASCIGGVILLFGALYLAMILAVMVPSIQHATRQSTAQQSQSTAEELTDAVEQWATDNSVSDGTTYTWTDISDHVPYYIQTKVGSAGVPEDEFGRPFVLSVTGDPVQLHPDTQAILDDPTPDFFWDK